VFSLVLTGLALLAGATAVAADARGRKTAVYISRPAAIVCLMLAALLKNPAAAPPPYRVFILAGLAASLAGDVFMILPRKKFAAGLAAFLAAQLCYGYAFWKFPIHPVSNAILIPFLVFALLVFRAVAPAAGREAIASPVPIRWRLRGRDAIASPVPSRWRLRGRLKFPVLVYIAAITGMAWQAADRFVFLGGPAALAAFAGAILFLASDAALAWNRFVRPFDRAQLVILGTYLPAQALFALSV
jgi:uncharacterized membrane protein YhhN